MTQRANDPKLDNRLPEDLKEAALALIRLPYASPTKRRHSSQRENMVRLKEYILLAHVEKTHSIGSIAEQLGKFKKAKVSRNYLGQMIALWQGTISRSALEALAPELFERDLSDAELSHALEAYGAADQAKKIRRLISGDAGHVGSRAPGVHKTSRKKSPRKR